MPRLLAPMISLGVLGAIDTYITATIFPVPVWSPSSPGPRSLPVAAGIKG